MWLTAKLGCFIYRNFSFVEILIQLYNRFSILHLSDCFSTKDKLPTFVWTMNYSNWRLKCLAGILLVKWSHLNLFIRTDNNGKVLICQIDIVLGAAHKLRNIIRLGCSCQSISVRACWNNRLWLAPKQEAKLKIEGGVITWSSQKEADPTSSYNIFTFWSVYNRL